MSVTADSSDGLRRHLLVKAFATSSSPIPFTGHRWAIAKPKDDKIFQGDISFSPSPTNLLPSDLTLPVFTPNSSSPGHKAFNSIKPHNDCTPPVGIAGAAITGWHFHRKSSLSNPSPSGFLSPRRLSSNLRAPILSLTHIDETKELITPVHKHLTDFITPPNNNNNNNNDNSNNNNQYPETLITAPTPLLVNRDIQTADSNNNNSSNQCYLGFDIDDRICPQSSSLGRKWSCDLDISSPCRIGSLHGRIHKFCRSDITFGKLIGKGGFGFVHEGTIGGRQVAVKIVQKRRGSGIHREIIQAERLAFKLCLRHSNIVSIYGVNMCEELRGDALILMELMTSQSLQSLLDDVSQEVKVRDRLRYALEISYALNYLHQNSLAHLDLKPSNILMTSEQVCKLSDFGSLTLTGPDAWKEEPEFTQLLGTLPYRAPELMTGCFPSTKADIYSFGISLWQMLTRQYPHKGINPHVLIYQVVKADIRPDIPDTRNDLVEKEYKDLYTACWSCHPEMRPEANQIISRIQNLFDSISW